MWGAECLLVELISLGFKYCHYKRNFSSITNLFPWWSLSVWPYRSRKNVCSKITQIPLPTNKPNQPTKERNKQEKKDKKKTIKMFCLRKLTCAKSVKKATTTKSFPVIIYSGEIQAWTQLKSVHMPSRNPLLSPSFIGITVFKIFTLSKRGKMLLWSFVLN